MNWSEAFAALFRWREPRSNALPDSERDTRRVNETEVQRLRRIERLGR